MTINNHNYETKSAGSQLSHEEWNNLVSDVSAANSNAGGGSSNVTVTDVTIPNEDATANVAVMSGIQDIGSPNIIQLTKKKKGVNTTLVSANNINIEPRVSDGSTKGGNISFKPGDDIEFCSHHRLAENQDEVSIKVIDGDDTPVKLQLNAAEMVLTTKDKTGDDAAVFDVTVNSAKNTRGYLKVRAQAIDLRSESHGGISLQPKGYDGDVTPHMNKIKFEHGGGDGLEFGTFNTEKSSLYTDEYRFKRDGKILLATRTPVARATDGTDPKYDSSDDTTHYTYTKQADDFYDVIYEGPSGDEYYSYDPTNAADTSVTWEDLVKLVSYMKTNHQGPWSV